MDTSILTDSQLIKAVKRHGDSEAFDEICKRYQNLFYKVCQKYSAALSSRGIFIKDIFDEKNIIILGCINSYDRRRKTKLSSHIGNYARYLCLNSMNERKLIIPNSDSEVQKRSEEEKVYHDYFQSNINLEESKNYIFNLLDTIKDKRIKEIFIYRYNSPKKMIWGKIAKKMNTSPQTIMSLHKKGITLIKDKIVKNEDIALFT